MASTSTRSQSDAPQVRSIPISSISKDGQTQHRRVDPEIVAEYSDRMREGDIFPPVRVWWDGHKYWLADGFHRIAAAERAGYAEITVEVRSGSLSDAQWDSFSANACHGNRRSSAESRRVVQLALAHPNAGQLSNIELSKHLHVSEKTIRRWRKSVSSARADNKIRLVTRGQTTYPLMTEKIGQTRVGPRAKSRQEMRTGLALMKERGSPKVRRLLIIIGNWALGSATAAQRLGAMERVVKD